MPVWGRREDWKRLENLARFVKIEQETTANSPKNKKTKKKPANLASQIYFAGLDKRICHKSAN